MLTFGGQVLRRAYRLRSALRRVLDLRVTTCPSGSCDTHAWDKLPKIGASSLASPPSAGIVTAVTIDIGAFGADLPIGEISAHLLRVAANHAPHKGAFNFPDASRSLFDAVAEMTGLTPMVRELEARLAADVARGRQSAPFSSTHHLSR